MYSELKGNYPDVTIKDGLTGEEAVYKANDILYYIFDEAHYFVNDSDSDFCHNTYLLKMLYAGPRFCPFRCLWQWHRSFPPDDAAVPWTEPALCRC